MIDALRDAEWSVSALPLGSGRVKTAHGILPVPAPATVQLLHGFDTFDDGIPGERITPTGAAILKHLAPSRTGPSRGAHLTVDGTGFGTRELPGVPNILRVLMFDNTQDEGAETGADVAVIEFEIDDQTPEDLAVGLDKLRSRDDVLDVLQTPVFGKKGRMAISVRVLCRPVAVDDVTEACFDETTTIGLRWHLAHRIELTREQVKTGSFSVKVIDRPGGSVSAKAEMEDVGKAAGGHTTRAMARLDAEMAALRKKAMKEQDE